MGKSIVELYKLVRMLFKANIPFQVSPDSRNALYPVLFFPNSEPDECIIYVNSLLLRDGAPVENNELLELVTDIHEEEREENITAEKAFSHINKWFQTCRQMWGV